MSISMEVQFTEGDCRGVQTVLDAINEALDSRGCIGNIEASEMSFSVSLHEAVAKLGGLVLVEDANGRVVVDFTGTGEVLT